MINSEMFSLYFFAIVIFVLKMVATIKKIKQKPKSFKNIVYIKTSDGLIIRTTEKGEVKFRAGNKTRG